MPKKLNFKEIFGTFIKDDQILDYPTQTSFSVTFHHKAEKEAQRTWLFDQFKKWWEVVLRESENALYQSYLGVEEKVVKIGIKIAGGLVETNDIFSQNLQGTIKKTLAQTVQKAFPLDFDPQNPLFDSTHNFRYLFRLACADWEEQQKRLDKLIVKGDIGLESLIQDSGAVLYKHPNHQLMGWCGKDSSNKDYFFLSLRWKQDFSTENLKILERILKAYFSGMGFHVTDCKTE